MLEATALRERTNAVQTRYAHDVKELDKLQKTNVYSQSSGCSRVQTLLTGVVTPC